MDLGTPGAGKNHYMVFHINESSNTNFHTQTVLGNKPGETSIQNQNEKSLNSDGTIKQENNANGTAPQGAAGNTAEQQKFGNQSRNVQRVATTIVLYMPPDIQATYAADWTQTNLGTGKEITDLFKSHGGGSLKELFQSAGASILQTAGDALNSFTDINLKDATSLGMRMVINNHQEVIFNGIGFRQFNFSFRLTPESEAEAENIDNIIRAFKFYSAPEILQGWAGRFWIYPAEFDLQYYANGKENLFLNRISTCALTNMTVNYTPVGHWAAFRSSKLPTGQGAPSVCTDITLQFTELELITKERVLAGY